MHPGGSFPWSISTLLARAGKVLAAIAPTLVIFVAACGGSAHSAIVQPNEPSQTSATKAPEAVSPLSVNRIAYINLDGELFTINPDGSDAVQLTGAIQAERRPEGGPLAQPLNQNEIYAWPTWSPDGTKLAASRIVLKDGSAEMTVQVIDTRISTFTTAYRNQAPSLVAESAPHYLYWAPDSRTLSFLAAGEGAVGLFLWDSASGGEAVAVEADAPLYYHWAADSGSMILHAGTEVKIRNSPPAGAQEPILADARGFRVPSFSPDGSQVAYVGDKTGGGGGALFVASTNDLGSARQLMEVSSLSAFLWSPDGSTLAVADQGAPGAPLFERLVLVPATGGEQRELAAEQLMAFFWAPTGERIAWAAVDARQGQIEWVVAPAAGGEERRLFRFRPSVEVLTMLSFFDQYVYSNYPWSPDGTALVVAGTQEESSDRRNGSGPAGARIYVLDAVGGAPPRHIAAGSVAFWSWN